MSHRLLSVVLLCFCAAIAFGADKAEDSGFKDGVFVKGERSGEQLGQKQITVRGRVVRSTDKILEIRLRLQGGGAETWTFAVKDKHLTLTDVQVEKGGRSVDEAKGEGEIQGGALRAKFSFRRDTKRKKNATVEGTLELNTTKESDEDEAKK